MKAGARRKTTLSSDLPQPFNPFNNKIADDVTHHLNNDGGNNADEARPKLAEGFYEIEALRKKRVRKGVKQYLIKWRGYPESANTWEPVENITSCPDVIEEFESMSSGKRKRKRKYSAGSLSQTKKKQQQQDIPDAAYDIPSEGIKAKEKCPDSYVNNGKTTENIVGGTGPNVTANQSNGLDGKLGEVKATSPVHQEITTEFAIHIQEDPAEPAIGVSKVDGTMVLRASPRFGTRRRKSFAVKRFKRELNSISQQDPTKKTTAASDVNVEDDVKNADDVVDGLDSENILDTPQAVSAITKILKPVNYSISVLNNTEEVFVSFLVLRSDGEEIVVDNKYLKENNPVLLINFYEQHLRYSSPSE